MPKEKFYVVWQGRQPGIYRTWAECEAQVKGAKGARYQSFSTEEEARAAYALPAPTWPSKKAAADYAAANEPEQPAPPPREHKHVFFTKNGLPPSPPTWRHDTVLPLPLEVRADAWAVDAACSGNPGAMEYRGVDLATGAEIFHYGPIRGTNNIGEFLAVVHALALMQRTGVKKAIYTDSHNALLWIRAGKCRTKLARNERTAPVYDLIARAEQWLATHKYADTPVLKWQTAQWGETPADFGRK